MNETLGATLRRLREARDLTLRDIEAQTDLSSGYLSLLENDKIKHPKPPVLHKLAQALGAPYPDLMGLAGYITPATGADRGGAALRPIVAFKGAERLTDDQRQEVQEFIDFKLRQLRRTRREGGN